MIAVSSAILILLIPLSSEESLPLLEARKVPQTFEELWAGYDPRAEPLEVEVLKEWEEDGAVLKVLRYRIGIFKGQKAMMAAVYGYPKGGTNLPGLVQIHGGGQYADSRAPLTNARRGYATLSIAWAGRINAPDYHVNPAIVKLFWEGKTENPNYRVTTDWGALDAYHAPCRYAGNAFARVAPAPWTLDAVESPRNNPWFLCTLGARRALTFLEKQPEVDPGRLGVYGHSMGGKLTVMTAGSDGRVKAAAPSCGGLSDRDSNSPLYRATIGDDVYLKNISCPIVFLSPSNDFHGRIEDLQKAVKEIKSTDWRVTCSPHHNHQDTAECEVATQLWFDQQFKSSFSWPEMPKASLDLKTADGVPVFTVISDPKRPFLCVDVFYTRHGQPEGERNDMLNTIARFWHHVTPEKKGDAWTARLPLSGTDKPLWVYANVLYPLETPVTGAGYYYGVYTAKTFNLSSLMSMASPKDLKQAGVKAAVKPSLVIETFEGDWEKEWFTYRPQEWARRTHKVYDGRWKAPQFAKLALEVRSPKPNKLVVGLDDYAAEVQIEGKNQWQNVVLFPTDFHNAAGSFRLNWSGLRELRLAPRETLRSGRGPNQKVRTVGAAWNGPAPEFRNLRWVEGTREELNARRKVRLLGAPATEGRIYLDLQYADYHTDGYKSAMNTWLDGKPLVIGGKTYDHGLTTHAEAETVFFLGGKFKRFHAIAQAWRNATVTFQVYIDGRKAFESGLLKRWETAPIDLALENAQELELLVTNGGNGKGGDHASWVDAWVEMTVKKGRKSE